jgi:hypothetical protein
MGIAFQLLLDPAPVVPKPPRLTDDGVEDEDELLVRDGAEVELELELNER